MNWGHLGAADVTEPVIPLIGCPNGHDHAKGPFHNVLLSELPSNGVHLNRGIQLLELFGTGIRAILSNVVLGEVEMSSKVFSFKKKKKKKKKVTVAIIYASSPLQKKQSEKERK